MTEHQKGFLIGCVVSAVLIFVVALYNAKKPVSVIVNTNLDFTCEPGTKLAVWSMVMRGKYKGELRKQCIK